MTFDSTTYTKLNRIESKQDELAWEMKRSEAQARSDQSQLVNKLNELIQTFNQLNRRVDQISQEVAVLRAEIMPQETLKKQALKKKQ